MAARPYAKGCAVIACGSLTHAEARSVRFWPLADVGEASPKALVAFMDPRGRASRSSWPVFLRRHAPSHACARTASEGIRRGA